MRLEEMGFDRLREGEKKIFWSKEIMEMFGLRPKEVYWLGQMLGVRKDTSRMYNFTKEDVDKIARLIKQGN